MYIILVQVTEYVTTEHIGCNILYGMCLE